MSKKKANMNSKEDISSNSSDDNNRFLTLKKKENSKVTPPKYSDSDSSASDEKHVKKKIINIKQKDVSETSSSEDKKTKGKQKKPISSDSDDSNSKSSGKGKKPSTDESDSDRGKKNVSNKIKPQIESDDSSLEDLKPKTKPKAFGRHKSTDSIQDTSSDDQKRKGSKNQKTIKVNLDSDGIQKKKKKNLIESSDDSERDDKRAKIISLSKKPQKKKNDDSNASNSDEEKKINKKEGKLQKKIETDTDSANSDSHKPKPKPKPKSKIENVSSELSDSEEDLKTLKRIIKKEPQNRKPDDEEKMNCKKNKGLKLIHIQTKMELLISQNVEVKRKKTNRADEIQFDDKILGINNMEISRNQCEFKPFQKGYVIVDKGSSNGTYIKLKKDYQTLVYPGMILEVGSFFLKIKKVSVKTIQWHLYQDESDKEQIGEKISNFKNKDKIKFGKNPGEKNDIQIDDSDLLDVQGYFEKKGDAIYVIASNDKKPLWLQLKDRNYLLTKNMVIKLSEDHQFIVAKVENVKLNKCADCEGIADLVFYPCFHNNFCSECRDTKFKNCPECKKEIIFTEIFYEINGS